MFTKAYTAIIQSRYDIKAVNVMVPPGDESKNDELISESYPGYSLVALVPGQHAKWCHVYMQNVNDDAPRKNSGVSTDIQSVDVWNTQELMTS